MHWLIFTAGVIYDIIWTNKSPLFKKVAVLKSGKSTFFTQKFSPNYCYHFRKRIKSINILANSRPETIIE